MKKVVIALTLIMFFSLSSITHATDFGANGLLTIPTADTLQATELELTYQRRGNSDLISGSYGIREGVQLGAEVNWPKGLDNSSEIYPKLKVNLLREDSRYLPELSLGVVERKFYLVASKSMPYYGLRAHLGVGDSPLFGDQFFGGLSKILNPVTISSGDSDFKMPTTTVMAEYNQGVNLGAKFNFGSGVIADLGMLDFDQFTFGINFKNEF